MYGSTPPPPGGLGLDVASMHAFWSLTEGILTFQLRIQFAGYL